MIATSTSSMLRMNRKLDSKLYSKLDSMVISVVVSKQNCVDSEYSLPKFLETILPRPCQNIENRTSAPSMIRNHNPPVPRILSGH